MLGLRLSSDVGGQKWGARPVVRLAVGTVWRSMHTLDPEKVFRDLQGFRIVMKIIRLEQVGYGVPMQSPLKPGRVGHSKKHRILTIDAHYNELNMVSVSVSKERPYGAVARDYLDRFAERLETAMKPLIAWCDRKDAWADRERFMERWETTLSDVKAGRFSRPWEFTTTPKIRNALDAIWALMEARPLEHVYYDIMGEAYFLMRDAGWNEAEYEGDPSAEWINGLRRCIVSNFNANLASSPPPDPTYGYSSI